MGSLSGHASILELTGPEGTVVALRLGFLDARADNAVGPLCERVQSELVLELCLLPH